MTKNKKVEFLVKLESTLNDLYVPIVKALIGDSDNNHRTLTVKQTIRYLTQGLYRGDRVLARRLSTAYSILRPTMAYNRKVRGSRSDSFDMGEFKRTLTAFITAEQVAKAIEYSI